MPTLNPGDDIQAAVTANSPGSTYTLTAGTYSNQNVLPKAGDTFIGSGAVILDGGGVTAYAFRRSGSGPDNVTIQNMRITNYVGSSQHGCILAGGAAASDGTSGWTLIDVEVDHCANDGIRTGHQMTMTRVNMHHNGFCGFQGFADDLDMDGCESAYNNVGTSHADSGGCKIVFSIDPSIRNSWFHHNNGPGLWLDGGVTGFLIDGNVVEDNVQEGIVPEVCFDGDITNNEIRRNGLDDPRAGSFPWGAGIGIHSSGKGGLEVSGNILEGNAHGIVEIQQARGTNHGDPLAVRSDAVGLDAEMYVQDVSVHDNTIVMQTVPGHLNAGSLGASQVVEDVGSTAIFTSRSNTFEDNEYTLLGGVARPFAWLDGYRTLAEWQAYGNDDGVTETPAASPPRQWWRMDAPDSDSVMEVTGPTGTDLAKSLRLIRKAGQTTVGIEYAKFSDLPQVPGGVEGGNGPFALGDTAWIGFKTYVPVDYPTGDGDDLLLQILDTPDPTTGTTPLPDFSRQREPMLELAIVGGASFRWRTRSDATVSPSEDTTPPVVTHYTAAIVRGVWTYWVLQRIAQSDASGRFYLWRADDDADYTQVVTYTGATAYAQTYPGYLRLALDEAA